MAINKKDYSKCNDLFTRLANFKNTPNFSFINPNITSINLLIEDETYYSDLNQIIVYKELKSEFTVQREKLWCELNMDWDKLLEINDCISIRNNIDQNYLNDLTKHSKYKTNSTLTGIFSFVFIAKMKQFCKKFLNFCETNIILNQSATTDTFEIINDYENKLKKLKVKQNLNVTDISPAQHLETKLNLIEQVLVFLNSNFFKLNVFINGFESDIQVTLMSIFSELILNDFVKLIYQQLIISIIPLKNYDYNLETTICQLVSGFETTLKSINFLVNDEKLKRSSSIFNQFVSNVEELYIRKKCKFIMEKSREQMKQKDLIFQLVRINENNNNDLNMLHETDSKSILSELIKLKERNLTINSTLDNVGLFQMPDCSISQTANYIIELVYETLNEAFQMAENSQDIKNISLLCLIARNLFDLYINVVPIYHKDNFKDLPLLSAIGYNDFIYLAFNCLTLTHQYKSMFLKINKTCKMKQFDYDELVQNFR